MSGNGGRHRVINLATKNRVEGNYIGTDKAGTAPCPTTSWASLVYAADENRSAGRGRGAQRRLGQRARRHPARGRRDRPANGADGNKVQGNYVGVAADGTTALPNRDNGVTVVGRRPAT